MIDADRIPDLMERAALAAKAPGVREEAWRLACAFRAYLCRREPAYRETILEFVDHLEAALRAQQTVR